MALASFSDVVFDAKGNGVRNAAVAVTTLAGAPAPIYADRGATVPLTNGIVYSDNYGRFKFYVAPGAYNLTGTKEGHTVYEDEDVDIGPNRAEIEGKVYLADQLNASASNGNAAIMAVFDIAADRYASGKYARIVIECDGLLVPVSPGLTVSGTDLGRNVLLRNPCLRPKLGEAWAADPIDADTAADIAFFDKYETVSAEGAADPTSGKVWAMARPLLTIKGNQSVNFIIENPLFSGLDSAGVRRANGLRVRGGSAIGRHLIGGRIEDNPNYSIFVGAEASNDADIDVTGTRFRPNLATNRADRTAYSAVYAGNDMHWAQVTVNYAHCPLLVGKYGSTGFFHDWDLFNGGGFDPTVAHTHRLMEYHGNTNQFVGVRLGNGQPHIHSPDLQIIAPKYGVTDGWQSRPDNYFVLHADKANAKLDGLRLDLGEMPIALRDDSMGLFEMVAEAPNSWDLGTSTLMSRMNGYTEILPGKKTTASMGTSSVVQSFESTDLEEALIEVKAAGTGTGDKVGFGLQVIDGVTSVVIQQGSETVLRIENGVLKPPGDRQQNLGSPGNEFDRAYIREVAADQIALKLDIADDPANYPPAGTRALFLNANERLMYRSPSGLISAMGVANEHLYRHYQTKAEIDDMRAGTAASINQTEKLNAIIAQLWENHTSPSAGQNRAGKGGRLNLGSGGILLDRLDSYPGFLIEGDSFSDTILVQASTATTDMVRVLARLGKTNKQRAPWGIFKNLTVQMTSTVFGPDVGAGPVPLHGLIAMPANTDPNFQTGRSYNSFICDHVRVYEASGNGFHCVTTRKRPWLYHSRASACAGDGIYIGDAADGKIDHCASGSNGGHSVAVIGGDTCKIFGGDFWSSANAASGKRAVYIERVKEGICLGADINGAVEYVGQSNPSNPEYAIPVEWKWIGNNFKFRDASFGDGGDGNPGTLEGYIITTNARGTQSWGNSFTPAWDRDTGIATYRPTKYYHINGSISSHVAMDNLPPIDSPMWAAGAPISGAPVNSWDDLCNVPARLGGAWTVAGTNKNNGLVMTRARFVPGADQGMVGRLDGTAPAETLVGEYLSDNKASGSAITLTNNTVATVVQLTLPEGEWDVTGMAVFTGAAATGTALKASLNPTTGTAIISNQASQYDSRVDPFTSLTGDIFKASLGPLPIRVPTTVYLTVRADFSSGSVGAWGRIQARRMA